jgi:hypothetical protein
VVSGNQVHRTLKVRQYVADGLNQRRVDTIVFECVAGNQNEIDLFVARDLDNLARAGQASFAEVFSPFSHPERLHPDLPVGCVQEAHASSEEMIVR